MRITNKITEAIKTSEHYKNSTMRFTPSLNSIDSASITNLKNGAEICLNVNTTYNVNGVVSNHVESYQFKIGIATPKGYFSTKKIPVIIVDSENLTELELSELMCYFHEETKENTFDPFYHKNQMERANASGVIYLASKLQADCR